MGLEAGSDERLNASKVKDAQAATAAEADEADEALVKLGEGRVGMGRGVPAKLLLKQGVLNEYLECHPESARRIQQEMNGVSLLNPGTRIQQEMNGVSLLNPASTSFVPDINPNDVEEAMKSAERLYQKDQNLKAQDAESRVFGESFEASVQDPFEVFTSEDPSVVVPPAVTIPVVVLIPPHRDPFDPCFSPSGEPTSPTGLFGAGEGDASIVALDLSELDGLSLLTPPMSSRTLDSSRTYTPPVSTRSTGPPNEKVMVVATPDLSAAEATDQKLEAFTTPLLDLPPKPSQFSAEYDPTSGMGSVEAVEVFDNGHDPLGEPSPELPKDRKVETDHFEDLRASVFDSGTPQSPQSPQSPKSSKSRSRSRSRANSAMSDMSMASDTYDEDYSYDSEDSDDSWGAPGRHDIDQDMMQPGETMGGI